MLIWINLGGCLIASFKKAMLKLDNLDLKVTPPPRCIKCTGQEILFDSNHNKPSKYESKIKNPTKKSATSASLGIDR
jgi:hypothetical protein